MNRTIFQRLVQSVVVAAAAASISVAPAVARDVATGQAGGGNCSLWQVIKSGLSGVDCRFL
jgi:hypothetical protein